MKPVSPPTAWGRDVVKFDSEPEPEKKHIQATMRIKRILRVVKTS
jgi:hypothetical protein